MAHKKKRDPYDPQPLNFDHAEETGPSDKLKEPYQSEADFRGDNEDDQYYETEEAISPEEAEERKEEDTI